jgi:hypothetical protein
MQKLTLVRYEIEDGCVITAFECDFVAQCDGTSIWADTTNKQVHVTGICIIHSAFEDSFNTMVNVTHNANWEIYTDRGFERAISDAVGFAVHFTEQGMQEDEFASMEC